MFLPQQPRFNVEDDAADAERAIADAVRKRQQEFRVKARRIAERILTFSEVLTGFKADQLTDEERANVLRYDTFDMFDKVFR